MFWQGAAYNEPPDAPWMSLREHCVWRDSPLLHAVCMGERAVAGAVLNQ